MLLRRRTPSTAAHRFRLVAAVVVLPECSRPAPRLPSNLLWNGPLWVEGRSVAEAADVDGVFDKLVQARANVRVWVTTCPSQDLTRQYGEPQVAGLW